MSGVEQPETYGRAFFTRWAVFFGAATIILNAIQAGRLTSGLAEIAGAAATGALPPVVLLVTTHAATLVVRHSQGRKGFGLALGAGALGAGGMAFGGSYTALAALAEHWHWEVPAFLPLSLDVALLTMAMGSVWAALMAARDAAEKTDAVDGGTRPVVGPVDHDAVDHRVDDVREPVDRGVVDRLDDDHDPELEHEVDDAVEHPLDHGLDDARDPVVDAVDHDRGPLEHPQVSQVDHAREPLDRGVVNGVDDDHDPVDDPAVDHGVDDAHDPLDHAVDDGVDDGRWPVDDAVDHGVVDDHDPVVDHEPDHRVDDAVDHGPITAATVHAALGPDVDAEAVITAVTMAGEGQSRRTIADHLGRSHSTVGRWIRAVEREVAEPELVPAG